MSVKLLVTTIFLALLGLFVPIKNNHHTALLIGGEYTVQPGETRSGNMLLIFAKVNIAKGGQVDGNLQVFVSLLDVSGSINGNINAYGSHVNVKTPEAQVDGTINTFCSIRGLPELPSILLVIS